MGPGLGTFFKVVSFLTGPYAAVIYGASGIAFLLLLGKTRAALVFATVGRDHRLRCYPWLRR